MGDGEKLYVFENITEVLSKEKSDTSQGKLQNDVSD